MVAGGRQALRVANSFAGVESSRAVDITGMVRHGGVFAPVENGSLCVPAVAEGVQ